MPPFTKTRLRNRNYSYQQEKLKKMVEKGANWYKLWDTVFDMQQRKLLPRGEAARKRVMDQAQKKAYIRPARYENKQLRARPRRLTVDASPTTMELLPARTRAKLYRDAIQICNYELGMGVRDSFVRDQIKNDTNQVFLARNADGTIVSYLLIDETYTYPSYPSMKVAEVNLICAQRGGGLKLLSQAIRHYRAAGYDMIRLEAVQSATEAYKRAKFKAIGFTENEGLVIMIYPLSDRVTMTRHGARIKAA